MAETIRRCTRVEFAEAASPQQQQQPPGANPGTSPSPLVMPVTNGAFAALDKRALLVGGYCPATCSSTSQVAEYDLTTRQWASTGVPFAHPISEATMVAVGQTYFLFGGFNDVDVLDGLWTLVVQGGEARGCAWEPIAATAAAPPGPSARRGHSMVVTEPSDPERATIFVFGGFDGQQRLGDLWALGVGTRSWRAVDFTSGICPPPRDAAYFAADPAGKRLILFGGFAATRADDLYIFDLAEERWAKHPNVGGPSPRHGGFAAVSGPFFVMGLGFDGKGPSGQICQLQLSDMRWTVPSIEGDEIDPRAHCSVALLEGGKKVLIFGGTNSFKYSTSMYELELDRTEVAPSTKGKK